MTRRDEIPFSKSDERQLKAYVKAGLAIEAKIQALNTEKSELIREAYEAGVQKRALKDLIRMMATGKYHDRDVPTLYHGLVDMRRKAREEERL